MKLRIRGNSIRLRLTRGEVEEFIASGTVEETVDFGPRKQGFTYALATVSSGGNILAEYMDNRLCIHVPENIVKDWAATNQTGIESNNSQGLLRILIEKDFECLAPRAGEDESDMFPNPKDSICQ